jgi:ABC-2 type transport system ATP-binding protein
LTGPAAGTAARAAGASVPAVVASSLTFRYPSGRRGVEAIDLEVQPGERVLLLGPNGSGKSTLIRLLAGLLDPGGGSVSVLAADTKHLPRRRMGVALDRVSHWEPLTTLENLVLISRASGMRPDRARAKGSELLARFGLDPDVPVSECSLGMRRKLLLAEALVHDPALLLLDEPTIGLDPEGVATLAAALAERSAAGAASVIASNDVDAAASLGQRAVFLVEGRKVADRPIDALLAALRTHTRLEVAIAAVGPRVPELITRSRVPADLLLRAGSDSDVLVADSTRGAQPLPELLRWLLDQGVVVRDVRVRAPDLRDVFHELTGKSLEDVS